jgi:hypothetical protein
VAKPRTILKINWLPLTAEANALRNWLQNESNTIDKVDLNLVGFVECRNLSRIAQVPETQIYLRNVTVLDFSQKYSYIACVRCLKKVEDGRCRTCGKRGQNDITQRYFIRGNIGDHSTVVPVVWADSFAELVKVQGFSAFQNTWTLKKVEVWLEKSANNFVTLVKLKETDVRARIGNLFAHIKANLL